MGGGASRLLSQAGSAVSSSSEAVFVAALALRTMESRRDCAERLGKGGSLEASSSRLISVRGCGGENGLAAGSMSDGGASSCDAVVPWIHGEGCALMVTEAWEDGGWEGGRENCWRIDEER